MEDQPIFGGRITSPLTLVMKDGSRFRPTQMRNRVTGLASFRVALPGTGNNTMKACEQVDETTMIQKVVNMGYSVRCVEVGGDRFGLYSPQSKRFARFAQD